MPTRRKISRGSANQLLFCKNKQKNNKIPENIIKYFFCCCMLSCCTWHPTPDSTPEALWLSLSILYIQCLQVPPGSSNPAFTPVFPFYDWAESGAPCSYHASFINVLKSPDLTDSATAQEQKHLFLTGILLSPSCIFSPSINLSSTSWSVTYTSIFNCCFKPFQLQNSLEKFQTHTVFQRYNVSSEE